MAMPLGMVARYDMISPDANVSTCATIYHKWFIYSLGLYGQIKVLGPNEGGDIDMI